MEGFYHLHGYKDHLFSWALGLKFAELQSVKQFIEIASDFYLL
jgi:hypothetical protein